ncbi:hypothetical protein C770_GR4pC0761 (plasmid) [Sinorhizobium meliloti GR4]|nr:hypothetical protein C770_GR4pC0761 [Sinorhizobium meliloti GR4]
MIILSDPDRGMNHPSSGMPPSEGKKTSSYSSLPRAGSARWAPAATCGRLPPRLAVFSRFLPASHHPPVERGRMNREVMSVGRRNSWGGSGRSAGEQDALNDFAQGIPPAGSGDHVSKSRLLSRPSRIRIQASPPRPRARSVGSGARWSPNAPCSIRRFSFRRAPFRRVRPLLRPGSRLRRRQDSPSDARARRCRGSAGCSASA